MTGSSNAIYPQCVAKCGDVSKVSLALSSNSFKTVILPDIDSVSFPDDVFKNELIKSFNLDPDANLLDIQSRLYNGISSGRIIIYPTFRYQNSFDILFLSSEILYSLPIYQALELSYSNSDFYFNNIDKFLKG